MMRNEKIPNNTYILSPRLFRIIFWTLHDISCGQAQNNMLERWPSLRAKLSAWVDWLSSQLLVIFHLNGYFFYWKWILIKQKMLHFWVKKSSFEWKNYDIFFQNSKLGTWELIPESFKTSSIPFTLVFCEFLTDIKK